MSIELISGPLRDEEKERLDSLRRELDSERQRFTEAAVKFGREKAALEVNLSLGILALTNQYYTDGTTTILRSKEVLAGRNDASRLSTIPSPSPDFSCPTCYSSA